MFKDNLNSVAHDKVIVSQFQKHFTQSFLVVFKQTGILIRLGYHFTQIIQSNLLSFSLKIILLGHGYFESKIKNNSQAHYSLACEEHHFVVQDHCDC